MLNKILGQYFRLVVKMENATKLFGFTAYLKAVLIKITIKSILIEVIALRKRKTTQPKAGVIALPPLGHLLHAFGLLFSQALPCTWGCQLRLRGCCLT